MVIPHVVAIQSKKRKKQVVPIMAQWLTNPTRNHEVADTIPGLAQWVRIQHCRELWRWLQTQLGSCIAVAVA